MLIYHPKKIPAFGFGDATTSDHSVFAFKQDGPCYTFSEVLKRYNEITPAVHLSGPTSFAPLIREAINVVKLNNNAVRTAPALPLHPLLLSCLVPYSNPTLVSFLPSQYHILVIIADGQVSVAEPTVNAIIEASNYPLSIIMIGVGDGPWDTMEEFDDGLPKRKFDNVRSPRLGHPSSISSLCPIYFDSSSCLET